MTHQVLSLMTPLCECISVHLWYSPRLFQRMLHGQEAGMTQPGQLLHPSLQGIDDLVLLELLILVDHFLIKHKHSYFLKSDTKKIRMFSSWGEVSGFPNTVNH